MCKMQFNDDDRKLFLAVKEKIKKDFREHLSYDELAKTFLIGRKKLEKGYVHFFGHTILVYRQQLQVNYACKLLRSNPGMTIQQVAYDAGFNERSTFYRRFITQVGTTPGRWKKNGNNKNRLPGDNA